MTPKQIWVFNEGGKWITFAYCSNNKYTFWRLWIIGHALEYRRYKRTVKP
jgi:hypothetical protein